MRSRVPSAAGAVRTLLASLALLAFGLVAGTGAIAQSPPGGRENGVSLIQDPAFPYGSPGAQVVLTRLAADGATVVALVPFLWQARPDSPEIVRGGDMSDDTLRAGIRAARAAGLRVMVKPHIWVPERWAGAVAMASDADWITWFSRYRSEIVRLARIAAEEKADSFSIGTEVSQSTERPEWADVIASVRAVFPGKLTYSAHWAEEVERFPFWDRLDAVGVTLYPVLGGDTDPDAWRASMTAEIDRVVAVANRVGKPVWVTEIGLRSATGATVQPWESAEERTAAPAGDLQADVLAVWYAVLNRPEVAQILVWRWITNPDAGGASDTDFTVQNKPAQTLLSCLWHGRCDPALPAFSQSLQAALAERARATRAPAPATAFPKTPDFGAAHAASAATPVAPAADSSGQPSDSSASGLAAAPRSTGTLPSPAASP